MAPPSCLSRPVETQHTQAYSSPYTLPTSCSRTRKLSPVPALPSFASLRGAVRASKPARFRMALTSGSECHATRTLWLSFSPALPSLPSARRIPCCPGQTVLPLPASLFYPPALHRGPEPVPS